MAFAFKTILLASLGAAVVGWDTRDTEIVLLPLWNTEDHMEMPLSFMAFDRSVDLRLRRNDQIVAPNFQVWKHDDENKLKQLENLRGPSSCHYLHRNEHSSAAISLCKEHGMDEKQYSLKAKEQKMRKSLKASPLSTQHGLIFLDNVTLEITPLQTEEIPFFNDHHVRQRSDSFEEPHIVKRAQLPSIFFEDDLRRYKRDNSIDIDLTEEELQEIRSNKQNNFINTDIAEENLQEFKSNKLEEALTLDLAVFFDEPGYNLFAPFFDRNDEDIRDMMLAYINGVQAIYHHPSLGITIDISLVRLEIMQKQPRDLPHFNGERGSLLDSFCNYAMKKNPKDEFHPDHWDMGLYVSGLDFYAEEAGQKNSATMGLATVGGVCIDQYSCVIAELGVTNQYGKPFPSAGFTSVYIAAHEIGHNLGMHHDSTGNACPKDGYIMSPSRGTHGETVWSSCSREVAEKLSYTKPCLQDRPTGPPNTRLDHTKFFNLPGRIWTSKKQCEVLLRDKDATVATLYKACEALQCTTPHRSGYYIAGPALDGTYCAPGKECRGGQCMNALQIPSGPTGPQVRPVGWSEWLPGACSSGCLMKSTGARSRRRFCNGPTPENAETGCQGPRYDVVLCRDDKLCNKKKRRSSVEFASLRCAEFSESLPELDGKGGGLQAPHEPERPWMACAIFCRRKDIASYYTPRVELNDLGLDPYFPDGTWCHAEKGQQYFCRQHHCLPESFRFGKIIAEDRSLDDRLFGPQNAHKDGLHLDDQVIKYFSLGPDGRPLLTSLSHGIGFPPGEDEWIDKDYVELASSPLEASFDPQHLRK